MKTTKGQLRNITSGILHTEIGDVYKFIEQYTDEKGIMTHHIPSACKALDPILKNKLPEEWFEKVWIKENLNDPIELPDLTEEEKKAFWLEFNKFNAEPWDVIKDKTIIVNTDKM